MFAEDVTEWNFGPEYMFQVNRIVTLYIYRTVTINVTAIVQCYPYSSERRIQNILRCRANRITFTTTTDSLNVQMWRETHPLMENFTSATNIFPATKFKIKFNKKGMQSFKVRQNYGRVKLHDESIANIVEQFNIGIDLSIAAEKINDNMKNYKNVTSGSHVISSFWHEEDTLRAKCNTSWIITYTPTLQNQTEISTFLREKAEKDKKNLQLRLLPIRNMDLTNKIFSIQRTRTTETCVCHAQRMIFLKEKWALDHLVITYTFILLFYHIFIKIEKIN